MGRLDRSSWVRFLRAVSGWCARKSLSQKDGMVVSLIFASWNQIALWLRHLDNLRSAA